MSQEPSISERLVAFVRESQARGVPEDVLHEAKRLILNQLKASVGATDNEVIGILHDWAKQCGTTEKPAHTLWFGSALAPQQAAVVNGALFEVLDFHDTYIPTFMHAVSAVLPSLLAAAEVGGQSGREVVNALALGLEVELACATMLMPTGYYRGFVPAGLVGGIGGATACSILGGLDDVQMRNALGLAMSTSFGTYETVGSMALSYVTGATARSGLTAYELAARGLDAPRTAFEGEMGQFVSHTNESMDKFDEVLGTLGTSWRIFGQTYKIVPTETITHGPVECALALLKRANGRQVRHMRFAVSPIVVKIANERMERFGNPNSELTARFDTRYCAAAAWLRGCFTLAEMKEPAYTDQAILGLRSRIELIADDRRATFDGCSLEIEFEDGQTEFHNVDAFVGSPGRRLTDAELSDVFRASAKGLLSDARIEEVLDATWGLELAPNIDQLMSLARFA